MENTAQNNRLIAEFLGFTPDEDGMYLMKDFVVDYVTDTYDFDEDNNDKGEVTIREGVVRTGFHPQEMEFNTNWNWLMACVEELENKGCNVVIGRMFCEITYADVFDLFKTFSIKIVSGVKINAVNGAIVEIIKWHNSILEPKQLLQV